MFKEGEAVKPKKDLEKSLMKDEVKEFLLKPKNRKRVFVITEASGNYIKIRGADIWFPYILFTKVKTP